MSVSTRSVSKTKPSGCGGDCGCGSANCSSSNSAGFSRPRFFAGQLLTDEDLQATLDYFVQKNRLHNRHFFGDGVVCGLQVQRHPCQDSQRKVIVRSGHALDCCGNDLIIPSDVDVDILKLVHDLRTKLRGGYDCGDPCKDLSKELNAPNNGNGAATKGALDEEQNLVKVKYDLYLRYQERRSDPVTPYQVDGDCRETCEYSRIRESYGFELRCPGDSRPTTDMRARLEQCKAAIPKFQDLQGDTLHGIRTLEMAEKVLVQFEIVIQTLDEPALPSVPFRDIPDAEATTFQQTLPDRLKNLPVATFKALTLDELKKELPVGEASRLLAEIAQMLSVVLKADMIQDLHVAAQKVQSEIGGGVMQPVTVEKQREVALASHRFLTLAFRVLYTTSGPPMAVEQIVRDVQAQLSTELPKLRNDDLPAGQSPVPISKEVLNLLAVRNQLLKNAFDTGEDGKSFDSKARIVGELVVVAVVEESVKRLDNVNEILRGHLASGVVSIDPALRTEMRKLQLGNFSIEFQLSTLERLQEVKLQADVVSRAVAEISKDCLCEIVLPPCPPSDDPLVLLASITVAIDGQKCEIVEICNLPRKFLLTGPSLRYWFSDFGFIFDQIRDACCPTPKSIQDAKNKETTRQETQLDGWKKEASVTTPGDPQFMPDFTNRIDTSPRWKKSLHVSLDVSQLGRAAIEPPPSELFDNADDGIDGFDSQALNFALAHLAGAPPSDIRNLLDWSEPPESPASIKRFAVDEARKAAAVAELQAQSADTTAKTAERKADAALVTVNTANTTAQTAQQVANTADAKAVTAQAAASTADGKAVTAQTAANTADAKAVTAQAAASTADAKAVTAQAAASTADGKAVTAQAAANTADAKAVTAQTAADTADAKAVTANNGLGNKVNTGTFNGLQNTVNDVKAHYREHLAAEHPPKDHGAP